MAVASARPRSLAENVAQAAGLDARLLAMLGVLILIWLGFDFLTNGIFLTARNLFNLSLQVSVVAEGVESEMQAMILRQFGCQGFQGYHFGRPMPLDDFVTSLDSRETIGGGLRLIVGEKHS